MKKKDKINWTVRKLEVEDRPRLKVITPKGVKPVVRVPITWTQGQVDRFLRGRMNG